MPKRRLCAKESAKATRKLAKSGGVAAAQRKMAENESVYPRNIMANGYNLSQCGVAAAADVALKCAIGVYQ